jgi:hypothetical protein
VKAARWSLDHKTARQIDATSSAERMERFYSVCVRLLVTVEDNKGMGSDWDSWQQLRIALPLRFN